MAVELGHPGREDPFHDLSFLSLFPQTLSASSDADSASETQGPESVQYLFKSMALKGSTKLLEHALAINKSSSNIEAEDKAVVANGGRDNKGRPLGRRPALGRKKGQFNLKTVQSDSSVDSTIYDIVEPWEYFSAVDQMQKAEEEVKKCRNGAATDLAQDNQSTAVRNRRVGILGRTATYKHHLSANADMTETFRASQGVIPDTTVPSPFKIATDRVSSSILHLETPEKGFSHSKKVNNELSDCMEGEGSTAEKEKSDIRFIDKFFSTFNDSDGGNGAALLQERLRIMAADVSKMNLPELNSTRRNSHRSLKSTVTKKRPDGSQPPKTMAPTTTKSPHAIIANLQRCISLKDPLADPYAMALTDDVPHTGDTFLSMGHHQQPLCPSEDVDYGNTNGITTGAASTPVIISEKKSRSEEEVHLPVHEADRSIDTKITSEEDIVKHAPSLENSIDHSRFDNCDVSTGRLACLEKEGNDMQLNASTSAQPDTVMKDPSSSFTNQNDMDVLVSPSSRNTDGNCSNSRVNVGVGSFVGAASLQPEVNSMLEEEEAVPYSEVSKDNTSTSRTFLQGDGHSENLCTLPEETNEIQGVREASGVSPTRGRKRTAPPSGQNKKKPTSKRSPISRRQSLADAGLMWKSGVRRSTRIKSRPLQYWCGERFLFGRIHDSLATVIGVKYACPDEDSKDLVLKVKSFVPEEYADLVSKAAV